MGVANRPRKLDATSSPKCHCRPRLCDPHASVFAIPMGQVMPLCRWLQYPLGSLSLERYCWWLRCPYQLPSWTPMSFKIEQGTECFVHGRKFVPGEMTD